jgi:hypothetical protein
VRSTATNTPLTTPTTTLAPMGTVLLVAPFPFDPDAPAAPARPEAPTEPAEPASIVKVCVWVCPFTTVVPTETTCVSVALPDVKSTCVWV